MKKKSSQILSDAADLIEEHGWVRGSYGNEQLGFCALGALYVAAGPGTGDAFLTARRKLLERIPDSITSWNDHYAASKAEVVAALRKAAE